jgi:predicted RNase H-like HicB family nuclease
MAEMKTYTAVIERDEAEGVWNAHLAEADGVFTFGRSLDAARTYIQEAAALWFDVDEVPLRYRIEIGPDGDLVDSAREARVRATEATDHANQATRQAATILTKNGYSRRDVAYLLGISYQRVQQILNGD